MRWSHLQKLIYELWSPDLELQIHCTAFRAPKTSQPAPSIGRYWVTLDGETIWEAPPTWRDDIRDGEISVSASDVTAVLRAYLDTPRDAVFRCNLSGDKWGVAELMNAADRRIGKTRLRELQQDTIYPAVKRILAKRLSTLPE